MTSKEALSDLSFLAIGDENHTIKCKEIIEKDLERLEKLEKVIQDYCYIDDFCTGNSDEVRLRAVLTQLQDKIDAQVNLNIRDLMKETIREARADMGTKEEARFYDRYIRQMKLEIDKEGNLRLVLNT